MYSKTHQGVVKETVILEFENGYQIKLEKGVEMSMHLVMDDAQIATLAEEEKQANCEHLSTYVESTRREYCSDCDMLVSEFG